MRKTVLSVTLGLLLSVLSAEAKTVRYELTATRGSVNLSGKRTVDFALMLNGSIPAPTLEFHAGDDAEIVVKNEIPGEELSIHWHGLLLPPEMDGVAYVNTPPILTGQSFTFRFRIRQNGTYWYHSHTNVQEQKGLYGAFIIHPAANSRESKLRYDRDLVVVLSDWSDENANDILKNLRKDGDYYLYKKNTMRSWLGAIQAGSLGNFLHNEWIRMGGMDYSDVGYDAFLFNGKADSLLTDARPGERIRIRIINAGASSYFHVALGQEPMTVVSADGIDIVPTKAKEILIGMAETYDVLFEVPKGRSTQLRATVQDGTGYASGWIGTGSERVPAPDKPFPDMYATMDHGSHGGDHGSSGGHADHGASGSAAPEAGHSGHGSHSAHGGHSGHDAHSANDAHSAAPAAPPVLETLTVDELRSPVKTTLPKEAPVRELKLVLGGDMERYVWHINGKAIHEDRTIEIREGDVVRFVFENKTMMHHPMHLHGHFFRVINSKGDYSPLKHTVDVPPHGTRTIEFYANEPGEWMLHCHNLYHMKTGMARVVKYMSYTPKPELAAHQKHDPHLHDHWYFFGRAEAATNHAQAYLRFSQTWNELEARLETRNTAGRNFSFDEPWEVEGDLFYRRWFNQFFSLTGGATRFDARYSAIAGIGYVLPFLIESELLVDHRGKFRLGAEKRFQWTSTVFSDADVTWRPGQAVELGEDLEFEVSLMYGPSWSWAAGLMLTDDSFGAGIELRF